MSGGNKTILTVEDDPATREIIRLACEPQHYNVLEAETGPEGLESVQHNSPDLVLLDINLPGMSGLDVCRKLRADGHKIPIIMLTAKSDTIDVVVGLELGADDYVVKPFEVRELVARIGAHLRRSESVPGDPIKENSSSLGSASTSGVDRSITMTRRCSSPLPNSICWRCWRAGLDR